MQLLQYSDFLEFLSKKIFYFSLLNREWFYIGTEL